MISLDGKTILITGASRGLGRAIASDVAQRGAQVIAMASGKSPASLRNLESLDDLLQSQGLKAATLVPYDLSHPEGLSAVAAALTDRYNHIDALILSAVHSPQLQPLGQTYPAVLQETFTINVVAQTSLIGACLPLLKAACHLPSSKKDDHAPTVVFVTDTPPEAYWGAYAASKKAMESIMGSYAQELAHTRIRFITVNPGPIATDMREKSYPGGPKGAAPHEAATAIVEKVWGPIQP